MGFHNRPEQASNNKCPLLFFKGKLILVNHQQEGNDDENE